MGLQQKHVIAVKVRPHATTMAGIADHEVIQARFWHKPELLHERMHGVVVQVHPLHQQGPVRRLQTGQRPPLEWPVPQLPGALGQLHQAGFNTFLRSQRKQILPPHRRRELGERLAHQQRLLLPVAAHELRRSKAAEQRQGLLDIHGRSRPNGRVGQTATILLWKLPNNVWSH